MPSIRKRMYGLIRTLSSPNASEPGGSAPESPEGALDGGDREEEEEEASFIYLYLTGRLRRSGRAPEIYYGKTGLDLPRLSLRPNLSPKVTAASTGPDGGLGTVPPVRKAGIASIANLDEELSISLDADSLLDLPAFSAASTPLSSHFLDCATDAALEFVDNRWDWDSGSGRAWGESRSLYEVNPVTKVAAGTPIADVFAVVAREDSCILALADGVNWGDRARLAARCAIRGAVDHLNDALFPDTRSRSRSKEAETGLTTEDVFHHLLGAFHSAHKLILQEQGTLTTLCVAVVGPLSESRDWVVCACNVGDSLAFVYNNGLGVREVTLGSHDIREMRDMRDAGGALGPVDGVNPELQNLTCSMTVVEPGDLVFITSDGVSDNFDPVVGKFCTMKPVKAATEEPPDLQAQPTAPKTHCSIERQKSEPTKMVNGTEGSKQTPPSYLPVAPACEQNGINSVNRINGLPAVDATQRHELTLLRMEDLLRHGVSEGDEAVSSARDLSTALLNFATQLTAAKRRTLEDPDLYGDPRFRRMDQKQRRRVVREKITEMPGKLDHASVVAFTVGDWPKEDVPRPRRVSQTSAGTQPSPQPCPLPTAAVSKEVSADFELTAASAQLSAAIELAPEPPPTASVFISMRSAMERRSHSAHSSAAHSESTPSEAPTPTQSPPPSPSPPQSPNASPPPTPTLQEPLSLLETSTSASESLPVDDDSLYVPLSGDADSITLSDASEEEIAVNVEVVKVQEQETVETNVPVPLSLSLEEGVPFADEDSSQSSSVTSGLSEALKVNIGSTEAVIGIADTDFAEQASSLPAIQQGGSEDEKQNGVKGGKGSSASLISSDSPSPRSELNGEPELAANADAVSVASEDPSVSVDFATAKPGYVEEAAEAEAILPDGPETAAALMNTSYYNATAFSPILPKASGPGMADSGANPTPTPSSPATKPPVPPGPLKKASIPQRTMARLESTLRRRKHRRNSPSRHTVAVDGSWLQRLRLGRKSESRDATPTTDRPSPAPAPAKTRLSGMFSGERWATASPPVVGSPAPTPGSGSGIAGRLSISALRRGGKPSPERRELSGSSSFESGAQLTRPVQLHLDSAAASAQPCDFRSPDALL